MKTLKELLAERAKQRKELKEKNELLKNGDIKAVQKELEDNKKLLEDADAKIAELEKDAITNDNPDTEKVSDEEYAEITKSVKGLLND